jgi:hypothetical protein
VRPDHLFLGTQAENLLDMHGKGRARGFGVRDGNNPTRVLTPKQVAEIRRQARKTRLHRDIAADFGVTSQEITRILNGTRWKN